jgi:thiol-disulfide isomerase/thioredoxin
MNSTSKKMMLTGLILLAGAAVYFTFLNPGQPTESTSQNSISASPSASSVYISTLKDLQGNPVVMKEDQLVFINVWATWCGPCNMEMPGIQKLYDKYKNHKKIAFYVISDEDAETVNPFVERKGYKLPFYQFAGPYPAALDGNAIPRTYIIYKGEILAQETGATQWDRPDVIEMIEKKLAEI